MLKDIGNLVHRDINMLKDIGNLLMHRKITEKS